MGIKEEVNTEFNKAYDKWILSRTVYIDKYGFSVPLGRYHPRLVSDKLWVNEDNYSDDEEKDDDPEEKKNRRRTPEKRVKNAIDILPALKSYNQELKKREKFRPDYEEILFHFRQLQMYANNEAKVKANETRQEYCWTHYINLVTENIHDMSADQGDIPSDQDSDDLNARDRGHMFSVARRSQWDNNSWQNSDIYALCRLGVSHNFRSKIWYDILEVQTEEDQCMEIIKTDDDYDQNLSAYENLKIITVRYRNIAFAQIDEDMRLMDVSNTPSRDDRGRIKNILK